MKITIEIEMDELIGVTNIICKSRETSTTPNLKDDSEKSFEREIKHPYSAFGQQVKKKLIELSQTQEWLIAACREETGKFIDSSSLNRILTGRLRSPMIEAAIRKILNI